MFHFGKIVSHQLIAAVPEFPQIRKLAVIGVPTVPGCEYDREIPVAPCMVDGGRVRGVVDVDNYYFEIPLTRGVFVILHPDVGMICFHHVLVRFESELSR